MSTREAVICEPVRTPIGRYGGMFKSLAAADLGVAALKGLLERTGIDRTRFYMDTLRRVGAIPGVRAAAGVSEGVRGAARGGGLQFLAPQLLE